MCIFNASDCWRCIEKLIVSASQQRIRIRIRNFIVIVLKGQWNCVQSLSLQIKKDIKFWTKEMSDPNRLVMLGWSGLKKVKGHFSVPACPRFADYDLLASKYIDHILPQDVVKLDIYMPTWKKHWHALTRHTQWTHQKCLVSVVCSHQHEPTGSTLNKVNKSLKVKMTHGINCVYDLHTDIKQHILLSKAWN